MYFKLSYITLSKKDIVIKLIRIYIYKFHHTDKSVKNLTLSLLITFILFFNLHLSPIFAT